MSIRVSPSIVVAGIGTDVGKTVAAAVLCEILRAEYWKPIASGCEDGPVDHEVIEELIGPLGGRVHPPRYLFKRSLSPHIAARLEDVTIDLAAITPPDSDCPLVVELAGGVAVPITDTVTNLDLAVQLGLPVVVVSRHYLGSINHTLLTIEALKSRSITVAGVIFNGDELTDTERIITRMSGVASLGCIPRLSAVTSDAVRAVAERLGPSLGKELHAFQRLARDVPSPNIRAGAQIASK